MMIMILIVMKLRMTVHIARYNNSSRMTIIMAIIHDVNVGEEHSRTAFLSNRHCGPAAETARTGCEAPSGLSRTHIFAFEFILSSEQGTHTQTHTYTNNF